MDAKRATSLHARFVMTGGAFSFWDTKTYGVGGGQHADIRCPEFQRRLAETARQRQEVLDSGEESLAQLREEIALLQKQVQHHPDAKRFSLESRDLRAELKQVKAMYDVEGHNLTLQALRARMLVCFISDRRRFMSVRPSSSPPSSPPAPFRLLRCRASSRPRFCAAAMLDRRCLALAFLFFARSTN